MNLSILGSGIKVFYRYCKAEGFVQHNPPESIQFLNIPDSILQYLEHEQLTALRENVKDNVVILNLFGAGHGEVKDHMI
jgi:site-specific recombinase XerD